MMGVNSSNNMAHSSLLQQQLTCTLVNSVVPHKAKPREELEERDGAPTLPDPIQALRNG